MLLRQFIKDRVLSIEVLQRVVPPRSQQPVRPSGLGNGCARGWHREGLTFARFCVFGDLFFDCDLFRCGRYQGEQFRNRLRIDVAQYWIVLVRDVIKVASIDQGGEN
jgi:hypothetical protein